MASIEVIGAINGTLSGISTIKGTISQLYSPINSKLTIPTRVSDYEKYKGPIYVVPKTNEDILLKTTDTIVRDDITVSKIPTFETSNESGTTFIIGG